MDLGSILDALRGETAAAVRDSAAALKTQFAEAWAVAAVVDDSPDTRERLDRHWAALGDHLEAGATRAARQGAFGSPGQDAAAAESGGLAQAVSAQLQAVLGLPAEPRDDALTRLLDGLHDAPLPADPADPESAPEPAPAHTDADPAAQLWRFLPPSRPYRRFWEAGA